MVGGGWVVLVVSEPILVISLKPKLRLINIRVSRQFSGITQDTASSFDDVRLPSLTLIFRAQKYKLRDYEFKPKLKLSVRSSYFNLEVRLAGIFLIENIVIQILTKTTKAFGTVQLLQP